MTDMTQTTGTTSSRNDESTKIPKPGSEHGRLDVFVGTWKTEGQQYEGAFGGAAKVSAEETYEWLPGGLFLVHRLAGRIGGAEMACIEIIESDRAEGRYRMHSFYNDGRSQEWQLTEHDGSWIISSDWLTTDGTKRKVRCTQRLENGGKTRTGKWESSADGTTWTTFWDVTSTKRDD
jgi:hypothetical protein